MQFEFTNPTTIMFGAGTLDKLGEVARRVGTSALLVTGGGSVKRNGSFARAVACLEDAGVKVVECAGVEPNPRLSTVIRGAQIVRAEGCEMVIALGGGSTMDAAKAIAATVQYEGEPWDMFFTSNRSQRLPSQALPIITVPTLAATGSEMNNGAVITNEETMEKSFVIAPAIYPMTAIVDPELTVTVPPDQTAYGICDLITHVTEGYFNGVDGTPLQDRFAEGVIQTAMEWGPRAVADGSDIEARTQIQWASVVALNGWVQAGTNAPYPVHMIEHTLSAHHDIAHAAGLAVVNPAWMRFSARTRPERFAQFAVRVLGIREDDKTAQELAEEGINRFEAFLRSLGCPTRLSELGIGTDMIETYADDTLRIMNNGQGFLPGRPMLSKQDIMSILHSAA